MTEETSSDEVESILAALLAEHPDATIFVLQRDDFGPPDRDHSGLRGLRGDLTILGPVEALDLLHPSSRPVALTALDRVADERIVRDELFSHDGTPIDSYLFDTFATRKLYIGLQIPVSDRAPVDGATPQAEAVPRRVVRMRTDGVGRVLSTDRAPGAGGQLAVGQLSVEAVHPDDLDQVRSVWASMLASPGVAHRLRYRARVGDGWAWQEAFVTSHLEDPADGSVHLEVIDISEEMAAHEEVRRRERTLYRLAEALPQAVVQLDRDGRAVYANGRAEAMLGDELDRLRPLLDSTVDDDRELITSALSEALGGADHDLEIQLSHPRDDHRMVAEVALRALSTDDGDPDGVMCCIADVTERARLRDTLEQRATFDQLTGVHNRGSALRSLAMALRHRGGDGVAVIFVDLDRFKEVNDRYGHQSGDEVLRVVASRLAGAVRGNDVVGRLGGDEFVVICPEVVNVDAARATAVRIAEALDPARVAGLRGVRASIGVAWSDADIAPSELMSQADTAMYRSKREGAGRVVVANPD